MEEIQGLLSQGATPLERERLQERLAKLTGGVTILRLGAQTGLELGDKKARCEDACFATRCALEDGIVPGAGMTLARIAQRLPHGIVSQALRRPALQILENAGITEAALDLVLKEGGPEIGVDSFSGTLKCDLVAKGIIDPAKVIKSSLRNAASVACQMLLTELVTQTVPDASN
jgi:chaperonin GroEL